jgi:hypothetical protein
MLACEDCPLRVTKNYHAFNEIAIEKAEKLVKTPAARFRAQHQEADSKIIGNWHEGCHEIKKNGAFSSDHMSIHELARAI